MKIDAVYSHIWLIFVNWVGNESWIIIKLNLLSTYEDISTMDWVGTYAYLYKPIMEHNAYKPQLTDEKHTCENTVFLFSVRQFVEYL